MIQALGFIDTSVMTANYLLRHKKDAADGILRLRDVKDGDAEATDLPILREWKSAKGLLARLRAGAASHFGGVTPELGRAWIETLPPMAGTPWDAESGDYADQHARTRTCLIGCPGALSYSGSVFATLAVGMVNLIEHRILCSEVNLGEHPRVHLVVDVRVPEATE